MKVQVDILKNFADGMQTVAGTVWGDRIAAYVTMPSHGLVFVRTVLFCFVCLFFGS